MTSTSVLKSIKNLLDVHEDYDVFDDAIIIHINSALMELQMLGVVGDEPKLVTGEDETWGDILQDREDLEGAKLYIYISVRLVFDRPEASYAIKLLEATRDRLAWMLEIKRQENP